MEKKVLVPVGNGSEDIETVTIVDVLRRAGANVTLASVESELNIVAARKTKIIADVLLKDVVEQEWDLIALPGGMPGAERLRDSGPLTSLLQKQKLQNKLYAAICAAPAVVLETHGLIDGKNATCHPNFEDRLVNKTHIKDRVVVDENLITSRGPGSALEFSLALVEALYGIDHAKNVAVPMLLPSGVNL
eukprot:TRINITY_DN3723_c0_g1_i1.p1 TRINITY_DN3723_c0_g1~~TRINITY_DN3723_c0_g1_i1.p1  ORF type:complete len:190 (-),score=45.07 TRINITY_DN3723_c0_g1_i1:111-680(-)